MTDLRLQELQWDDDKLTEEEVLEGWVFCDELDYSVVNWKTDCVMEECTCKSKTK